VTERPNRRATDRGPADSPLARQRRVVRMIAADPVLVQWLATLHARKLHEVAADLTAAGHDAAAELVHQRADAVACGKLPAL
jgi:hypothetical protein